MSNAITSTYLVCSVVRREVMVATCCVTFGTCWRYGKKGGGGAVQHLVGKSELGSTFPTWNKKKRKQEAL